jgi:hypothetical protein
MLHPLPRLYVVAIRRCGSSSSAWKSARQEEENWSSDQLQDPPRDRGLSVRAGGCWTWAHGASGDYSAKVGGRT